MSGEVHETREGVSKSPRRHHSSVWWHAKKTSLYKSWSDAIGYDATTIRIAPDIHENLLLVRLLRVLGLRWRKKRLIVSRQAHNVNRTFVIISTFYGNWMICYTMFVAAIMITSAVYSFLEWRDNKNTERFVDAMGVFFLTLQHGAALAYFAHDHVDTTDSNYSDLPYGTETDFHGPRGKGFASRIPKVSEHLSRVTERISRTTDKSAAVRGSRPFDRVDTRAHRKEWRIRLFGRRLSCLFGDCGCCCGGRRRTTSFSTHLTNMHADSTVSEKKFELEVINLLVDVRAEQREMSSIQHVLDMDLVVVVVICIHTGLFVFSIWRRFNHWNGGMIITFAKVVHTLRDFYGGYIFLLSSFAFVLTFCKHIACMHRYTQQLQQMGNQRLVDERVRILIHFSMLQDSIEISKRLFSATLSISTLYSSVAIGAFVYDSASRVDVLKQAGAACCIQMVLFSTVNAAQTFKKRLSDVVTGHEFSSRMICSLIRESNHRAPSTKRRQHATHEQPIKSPPRVRGSLSPPYSRQAAMPHRSAQRSGGDSEDPIALPPITFGRSLSSLTSTKSMPNVFAGGGGGISEVRRPAKQDSSEMVFVMSTEVHGKSDILGILKMLRDIADAQWMTFTVLGFNFNDGSYLKQAVGIVGVVYSLFLIEATCRE